MPGIEWLPSHGAVMPKIETAQKSRRVRRLPILVATSVREWFVVLSLTLVATRATPEQGLGAFAAAFGG
jgi:hypothetical protein